MKTTGLILIAILSVVTVVTYHQTNSDSHPSQPSESAVGYQAVVEPRPLSPTPLMGSHESGPHIVPLDPLALLVAAVESETEPGQRGEAIDRAAQSIPENDIPAIL